MYKFRNLKLVILLMAAVSLCSCGVQRQSSKPKTKQSTTKVKQTKVKQTKVKQTKSTKTDKNFVPLATPVIVEGSPEGSSSKSNSKR